MEGEVFVLTLELFELFLVEDLAHAATAVPVGDLAAALEVLEQLEDVAAQRRHARAAADVDHLGLRVLDEELAVRSGDRHLVAGLEVEDVGRGLARRSPRGRSRRGRGDADVEHDDALLARIVGHRVGPFDTLRRGRADLPQFVAIPLFAVLLLDVELVEGQLVRGDLDLNVAAGLEVHLFIGR